MKWMLLATIVLSYLIFTALGDKDRRKQELSDEAKDELKKEIEDDIKSELKDQIRGEIIQELNDEFSIDNDKFHDDDEDELDEKTLTENDAKPWGRRRRRRRSSRRRRNKSIGPIPILRIPFGKK